MTKNRILLVVLCLVVSLWTLFFLTTQSASSSPLLGFTLTPTKQISTSVSITDTPAAPPTNTPGNKINTLPPGPPSTKVLIPVTGASQSLPPASSLLIVSGLLVSAVGLVCLGLSRRKK
jgi:hypothetical protein